MAKLPESVHEANVHGAPAMHYATPKKHVAPDNKPTREAIYAAYSKAEAAGDERAKGALLDAIQELQRQEDEALWARRF